MRHAAEQGHNRGHAGISGSAILMSAQPRPIAELTPRQQREVAFYHEYADRQQVESLDFAPVQGEERRPWNPYWAVYEMVCRRYVGAQQRLLDFGCGAGVASVRFAHVGFTVDGFDISEDNLRVASDLAERYRVGSKCSFRPMTAEKLLYADDTFDIIVGIDILHHVDIPRAIAEARRVLRPGGVAIFKEHVEAPLVEPIRNTALLRAIAPREQSLDDHITEDERKLNADDLSIIRHEFDHVETKRFTLLGRLDRLLPRAGSTMRGRLQRLDHGLMRICPPLERLGGTVVLTCHKSAKPEAR